MMDLGSTNGNPYLQEVLHEQHPLFGKVLLHPQTAATKGLSDGDMVYMEGQFGGKIGPYPVKITGTVHPEVVGVMSGMGDRNAAGMDPLMKRGIAYNRLLSYKWETVDIIMAGIELSPRSRLRRHRRK